MKNTFKYIAALVAFSAAPLVSGLSVSAQNLPDGTYKEENGIAFAKRAHINTDGTYTIDLESFVTGEVTQTFEAVPVDVVLVLDVSGSMDETISSFTYNVASHRSIAADDYFGMWDWQSTEAQTNYYYLYNGKYYQVFVGRGGSWQRRTYFLFFTVNGIRYHINSNGQVVTEEPTNVTDDGTNLWNSSVTFYTRTSSSTGVTKMQALRSAVDAFIDQIAHNDLYEDDTNDKPRSEALGNRISIVKFGLATYNGSTTFNANTHLTAGDHFCSVQQDWGGMSYYNYTTTYNNNYNVTEVLAEFTPTGTTANVNNLKSAVSGLHSAGATAADFGMRLAYELINRLGDDRANSSKTVVFFTDGAPTHSENFDNTVANSAITYSNNIKAITYGSGEDATHPSVYSVGVFSGDSSDQITNFMTSVASGSDHFFDASGGSADDLKDIFTSIAHSAGGSGNTQVSGGSTMTVDIVSSSFSVPKGFENNPGGAIEVLVAPCNGKTNIDGKEYFTFGTAKAPSEYGFSITPSISEADNKVSTTGFDYSENWCGPDPTSATGWHGYKQIIRFVITVNDDAVGGPNVATNDSDSGIYLEGSDEPLVKFNRPTVKLPVQIWIQKQGLRPGDSAVFTLAMCKFAEWDPDQTDIDKQKWSSFTKVVINYSDMDENGLVKIVGLDPDYFYRLKEDAWAFGYTYQDGGVQYTVGDNVANPFIFENKPKDLKFDEASARNIFNEKTDE